MSTRLALILCVCLAAISGFISYRASVTKSPTIDEPTHFGSAYAHVFLRDDRTDPENPVLWKWWAMLPIHRDALSIDPTDRGWMEAGKMYPSQGWVLDTMFKPNPQVGIDLINRARLAMTLLGVALCLMTAWWAHQIAGPWAAIAAAAIVSLDPTVLAHAPIVKNDIPLTLAMLASMVATWRAGRRLTALNALAMALACAVAINIKYSAILLPVIVVATLLARLDAGAVDRVRPATAIQRRSIVDHRSDGPAHAHRDDRDDLGSVRISLRAFIRPVDAIPNR